MIITKTIAQPITAIVGRGFEDSESIATRDNYKHNTKDNY